jgi:hypothetical protein
MEACDKQVVIYQLVEEILKIQLLDQRQKDVDERFYAN